MVRAIVNEKQGGSGLYRPVDPVGVENVRSSSVDEGLVATGSDILVEIKIRRYRVAHGDELLRQKEVGLRVVPVET